MRNGHRLAVPRGGIRRISAASSQYISAMMSALMPAASHSTWRAERRLASARRECEGARTNCASDAHSVTTRRAA